MVEGTPGGAREQVSLRRQSTDEAVNGVKYPASRPRTHHGRTADPLHCHRIGLAVPLLHHHPPSCGRAIMERHGCSCKYRLALVRGYFRYPSFIAVCRDSSTSAQPSVALEQSIRTPLERYHAGLISTVRLRLRQAFSAHRREAAAGSSKVERDGLSAGFLPPFHLRWTTPANFWSSRMTCMRARPRTLRKPAPRVATTEDLRYTKWLG